MKNSTLLILTAITIVLASAYFLTRETTIFKNIDNDKSLVGQNVIDLDFDKITTIEISKAAKKVRVIKQGENWILASNHNRPVDNRRVEAFMKTLKAAPVDDIVATKASTHTLFKLDAAEAVQLKLLDKQGEELANLFLGKTDTDTSAGFKVVSTFLRYVNDDKVLKVTNDLLGAAGAYSGLPQDRAWLDFSILNLSIDDIASMRIFNGEKELNISRISKKVETTAEKPIADEIAEDGSAPEIATTITETKWVWVASTSDNKEQRRCDDATVRAFVEGVSALRAQDFADEETTEATSKLNAKKTYVIITLSDNTTHTVIVGARDKKSGGYYLKRSNDNEVFIVADYIYGLIFDKSIDDLIVLKTAQLSEEEQAVGAEMRRVIKDVVSDTKKGRPTEVRTSHILISYKGVEGMNATRTEEEAKALANKLHAKLTKKPTLMGELALEYSDDPTVKKNQGDLGRFGKGRMLPLFEETAFDLSVGGVSEVIKTAFGFHIIIRTE